MEALRMVATWPHEELLRLSGVVHLDQQQAGAFAEFKLAFRHLSFLLFAAGVDRFLEIPFFPRQSIHWRDATVDRFVTFSPHGRFSEFEPSGGVKA
jgi:hypothetical protein